MRADIVVLDDAHPALIGRSGDGLLDSWIFSGGNACVKHVFVAGEQLVKDRRHRHERRHRPALPNNDDPADGVGRLQMNRCALFSLPLVGRDQGWGSHRRRHETPTLALRTRGGDMNTLKIGDADLTLDDVRLALAGPCRVRLEAEAKRAIAASHAAVLELLKRGDAIYGVNTGFGKLAKARIADRDLNRLADQSGALACRRHGRCAGARHRAAHHGSEAQVAGARVFGHPSGDRQPLSPA